MILLCGMDRYGGSPKLSLERGCEGDEGLKFSSRLEEHDIIEVKPGKGAMAEKGC